MEGLYAVLSGSAKFACFQFVHSLPPLKKKASERRSIQLGYEEEGELVEGRRLWWAPSRRLLKFWRSLVGHW